MLDSLQLINFPTSSREQAELLASSPGIYALATCQRTLLIGLGAPFELMQSNHAEVLQSVTKKSGREAYEFLLQTICGLKSQVVAESEITRQFKQAYQAYTQRPDRDTGLMSVLEKLFKDAKHIRRDYLLKVGQQSYAGISKKLLNSVTPEGSPVVILGSGELAHSLLKILSKRYRIILSARNSTRVEELAMNFDFSTLPWGDDQLGEFPFVINTIGASQILYDQAFFSQWKSHNQVAKLFIDLGSPSVINTPYTTDEHVFRLEDVLSRGAMLDEKKKGQIEKANLAITELVGHRREQFKRQNC